jgi:hypothetical protein
LRWYMRALANAHFTSSTRIAFVPATGTESVL